MTPNSKIVVKIKAAVYYVASQQFSQCPNTPWPSSYSSGFIPKGCTFMSMFLVLVFCSYYIYFVILSLLLSFPFLKLGEQSAVFV